MELLSMTLLACLCAFAAAALGYLSSPQQRLLPRRLSHGRWFALAAAVGALICWIVILGTVAGAVGALTATMLLAVALPYLAWWLQPATRRDAS
jgi:hypothetical protein